MITEKKKLHIRNFLLIILMLCFIPFCNRTVNKETSDSALTFESENIRAVVAMSNDMYGKKGHKAGLNYEMLLNFTKEHDCTADIKAAKKGENWIDSLKLGVTDLVIMEYNDTTDYTGIKISNVVDNIVWAVSIEKAGAQKDINVWLGTFISSKEYSDLKSRFYRIYDPAKRVARGDVSKRLSPYDDLIKKYAKEIGWDWRMLAAVIYQESKFSINGISPRGAQGLMQVRPSTARVYGVDNLLDPEQNIIAGTRFLARLSSLYRKDVSDPLEKMKFTLAAYNAGEGRIADCRNYAASRQIDSCKWEEVVKIIPDMRSNEILQEDTVKLGKFKGYETINYVSQIMSIYEAFCKICPEA